MKYGHLERFRVELAVQSPLYIGSGVKLSPMEYIMENNTLYVPSMPDMIEAFANDWRRGLVEDFQDFALNPRRGGKLGDFIRKWSISMKPLPPWIRYTVSAPGYDRANTLLTFIRNPEGQAYIPGSSIKGALRTALIAARLGERDKAGLRSELETNPTARYPSAVEKVLRTLRLSIDKDGNTTGNAVNDLLRAVEISDSAPYPSDSMTVCRRYWLSEKGDAKQGQSPVFMECLRPGSRTAFYLTVDQSLWPAGKEALSTLRDALDEWDELCKRVHDSHFGQYLEAVRTGEGTPIVLGGGTGFHRKSLVYRISGNQNENVALAHRVLERQFTRRNGSTYKPRGAKTAPYRFKAARFDGLLYPMGVCSIRL